jgi:hypothetical protein
MVLPFTCSGGSFANNKKVGHGLGYLPEIQGKSLFLLFLLDSIYNRLKYSGTAESRVALFGLDSNLQLVQMILFDE